MQQFLKPTAGQARAGIVAAELFDQVLVTVHDPVAALDVRLGREATPTLARRFETPTVNATGRGLYRRASRSASRAGPSIAEVCDGSSSHASVRCLDVSSRRTPGPAVVTFRPTARATFMRRSFEVPKAPGQGSITNSARPEETEI